MKAPRQISREEARIFSLLLQLPEGSSIEIPRESASMSSDHSIVPLRDHLETRIGELDRRINERFEEHEKALILARDNTRVNIAIFISILSLIAALWARK